MYKAEEESQKAFLSIKCRTKLYYVSLPEHPLFSVLVSLTCFSRRVELEPEKKKTDAFTGYRVFSRDVAAAMLVSLNKGVAAMLVSQTKPSGIELYSYATAFFCFG